MANFNDNFYTSGNLDDWTIIGSRNWFLADDLLKPEDSIMSSGVIVNDTSASINGVLTVEYNELDQNNGDSNLIIFRYQDENHFYGIKIDPGNQLDSQRSVYFSKDQLDAGSSNDIELNLFNISVA